MDLIDDPLFKEHIARANVLRSKRDKNRLYLTPQNEVIKIFYARDYFIKAKRRVHRFLENAHRLLKKDIKTIEVKKVEEYPKNNALAVYYSFIKGKTAIEWYQETHSLEWLYLTIEKLLLLQQKKIYFSDFHADNILFDSQKNFYLLDIHNAKFPYQYSLRRCGHNLATLLTKIEHQAFFSNENKQAIINKYLELSRMSPWKKEKFLIALEHYIRFYQQRRHRGKYSNAMFKFLWIVKPIDLYDKAVVFMLRFFVV